MSTIILIILIVFLSLPIFALIYHLYPGLKYHDGEVADLRRILFVLSIAKLLFLYTEVWILAFGFLKIKAVGAETWGLLSITALFGAVNWYAFFIIRKLANKP